MAEQERLSALRGLAPDNFIFSRLLSLFGLANSPLFIFQVALVLQFLPLVELEQSLGGALRDEVLSHAQSKCICGTLTIFIFIHSFLLLRGGLRQLFQLAALTLLSLENLLLLDRVLGLDDREIQIEQEKGAKEDQGHEEENDERRIRFLVHDHDVGPAFQRHALENV